MSILVRFSPEAMTAEQYDGVSRQLEEGGSWPPDGLDYHVCFGSDGNLKVSEVWDSKEQLEAFGERLMPVLKEHQIDFSAEPEIIPIHKIEKR